MLFFKLFMIFLYKLSQRLQVGGIGMSAMKRSHRAATGEGCGIYVETKLLKNLAQLGYGRVNDGRRTEAHHLLYLLWIQGASKRFDATIHFAKEDSCTDK